MSIADSVEAQNINMSLANSRSVDREPPKMAILSDVAIGKWRR